MSNSHILHETPDPGLLGLSFAVADVDTGKVGHSGIDRHKEGEWWGVQALVNGTAGLER